jgi:ABC-type multidrug transport system fused ATPase/permease subunit
VDLVKRGSTLIVAHRLATAKKRPTTVVPQVVAIGTHDEPDQRRLYARLAKLSQFTDGAVEI